MIGHIISALTHCNWDARAIIIIIACFCLLVFMSLIFCEGFHLAIENGASDRYVAAFYT